MPNPFRVLITAVFFVQSAAWACSSGGCTKPSDFSSSGSTMTSDIGTGGGYTPPYNPPASYSGGAGATSIDTQGSLGNPMPKATTGDPKKVIDWNTMAQSSPEARGVLSRFNRIQPKVTATKTAESAAETLAKEQVSARGSNVIQPESIRAMRGLASQERRLPRTLGEDGSAN